MMLGFFLVALLREPYEFSAPAEFFDGFLPLLLLLLLLLALLRLGGVDGSISGPSPPHSRSCTRKMFPLHHNGIPSMVRNKITPYLHKRESYLTLVCKERVDGQWNLCRCSLIRPECRDRASGRSTPLSLLTGSGSAIANTFSSIRLTAAINVEEDDGP